MKLVVDKAEPGGQSRKEFKEEHYATQNKNQHNRG